jgi:hypothetical protein
MRVEAIETEIDEGTANTRANRSTGLMAGIRPWAGGHTRTGAADIWRQRLLRISHDNVQ